MLTVSIATDNRPPAPQWGREVNVWRDETGRVFARGFSGSRRCWIDWPDIGLFGFAPGSREVRVWLAKPDRAAAATDAGLRVLQPMILQALGWQALHASAVALPDGVVAFCGRSGQGKSTLAYALAARGFLQFADDAVLLEVEDDRATAHPLPFTPRLRAPSIDYLRPAPGGDDRRTPTRLQAVWILETRGAEGAPDIERIPAVPAFSSLLTHAHCFDPSDHAGTERMAKAFMSLAASVPVMRLSYPKNFDRLDAVLEAVMAAVSGSSGRPASATTEARSST